VLVDAQVALAIVDSAAPPRWGKSKAKRGFGSTVDLLGS